MFDSILSWLGILLLVTGAPLAAETVTVRSGNGTVGGRDGSVTFLLGPAIGDFNHVFTASDFSAAQTGPPAFIIRPNPLWISGLSEDASAKWIGTNANAATTSGNTALYAVSFKISAQFSSATLTLHYASDDTPSFSGGILLNGTVICQSSIEVGFSQEHTLTCDVGSLLQVGTNWLYFNITNVAAAGATSSPAGLLFSATASTTDVAPPSSGTVPFGVHYATYFGGSGKDTASAIALDSSGDIYLVGTTTSSDLPGTRNTFQPTKAGSQNVFVAKLDPTGTRLLWASYLGGNQTEYPTSAAVDTAGNLYVTGITYSSNFPTTTQPFSVAKFTSGSFSPFLAKIAPDGTKLIYSCLLPAGFIRSAALVSPDGLGDAHVAGLYAPPFGASNPQPFATPGALNSGFGSTVQGQDTVFLTDLNAGGTSDSFIALLGAGAFGPADGNLTAIAVDPSGNAYVAGYTDGSANALPTILTTTTSLQPSYSNQGLSSGFVVKVDSTGSKLLYGTYFGPKSFTTQIYDVLVDTAGSAYLIGYCYSASAACAGTLLATPGSFQASGVNFVAKVNSTASAIQALTYLPDSPVQGVITVDGKLHVLTNGHYLQLDETTLGLVGSYPTSSISGLRPAAVAAASGSTVWLFSSGGNLSGLTTGNTLQPTNMGANTVLLELTPVQPAITAAISNLVFSYQPGGSNTLTQNVQLAGNIAGLSFTAQASSSGWLSVSPTSGTAPTTIAVTVNPGNLNPGTYNGSIAITGTTGAAGTTIPVVLSVNTPSIAISPGGIVNSASALPGPVAPGSIASVYGIFPLSSPSQAPVVPWPLNLSGLSMQFTGIAAPLYYVSASLVDLQIPWELAGASQASVIVGIAGQTSVPQTVSLATASPGLFSMNAQGTGQGAILDSQYRLVDSSNPASVGDVIQIYCTGLGPVTNQPATGSPAPTSPLAETINTPAVMIGGLPAQVWFSGLTPGTVGLYQINAQIPAGIVTGPSVPMAVSMSSSSSNTVTVAVQPFPPTPNPQPSITGLSPSSIAAETNSLTLTISGTGFITSSAVTFNGIAHQASLVNGSQLAITLSASDLAIAGTFPVVVTNPSPGGGTSKAAIFTVSSTANPVPAITSLIPASAGAGTGPLTLNINGSGFTGSSTVTFNGTPHAVSAFTSTLLVLTLTQSDLSLAGTLPVVVTNPAPGGGQASATLTVTQGVSIAGVWQGTWGSTLGTSGSISATINQSGSLLAGTVSVTNSRCFTAGTISTGSTISGSNIVLHISFSGGLQMAITDGQTNGRGQILGNYTVQGGSCADGPAGSVSLSQN
jgi:uncharacterized protein (TIGR03437 family)